MSRVKEKIANTKEVFRISDADLDKVVHAEQLDRLALVQKLRAINEELSDMVLTLVKKNESLKIQNHEKAI